MQDTINALQRELSTIGHKAAEQEEQPVNEVCRLYLPQTHNPLVDSLHWEAPAGRALGMPGSAAHANCLILGDFNASLIRKNPAELVLQ